MEFVPILTFSKCVDWCELFLQCLPLGDVYQWSVVVAHGTYALEASTIFAVVQGGVAKDFRRGQTVLVQEVTTLRLLRCLYASFPQGHFCALRSSWASKRSTAASSYNCQGFTQAGRTTDIRGSRLGDSASVSIQSTGWRHDSARGSSSTGERILDLGAHLFITDIYAPTSKQEPVLRLIKPLFPHPLYDEYFSLQ